MIHDSLFSQVLIDPIINGASELLVVSGYATSAMAFHHLEKINEIGAEVNIRPLVGMCSSDGISISNHRGFQKIMNESYSDHFSCSYIYDPPPVHSKLYIWRRDEAIVEVFAGSANYTQNAFSNRQREILASIAHENTLEYFNSLEQQSIFCNHADTDGLVTIYNDKHYYRRHEHEDPAFGIEEIPSNTDVENIRVSLLSRTGDVQRRGGLNWGQREGRDPNQAYLQLSPDVYRSDFFPLRGTHFTVVTDDSKTFICTRAQKDEEGHAIETPHNNALLGEYFRNRLGLPNGAFVSKENLEKYGRTDVTFYKFDSENYYMDFSTSE